MSVQSKLYLLISIAVSKGSIILELEAKLSYIAVSYTYYHGYSFALGFVVLGRFLYQKITI